MDVIAEEKLIAVYPDGVTATVCLRVGRPMPHPDGDWGCSVQSEGLRLWDGPKEFTGVGSWHALMLGLRFLHSMLLEEVERGAVLHREDGEHPISVEEVFVLQNLAGPGSAPDDSNN